MIKFLNLKLVIIRKYQNIKILSQKGYKLNSSGEAFASK